MTKYLTLLLFLGLAWGQNKVNINNLVQYGDKMFEQNEDKPYTGKVFDLSKSTGEKILDGWYRDGKKSGRWTYFTIEGNGKYKLNYDNVSLGYKDYIENYSDYTQEYGKGAPTSGEFIDQFGKRYKGRLVLNEDDIGIFKKQDGSYLELKSLDDFSHYPKFYFSVKNDMIHGLTVVWHDNGFKEREGKYVDGEINGLWNFWYENGSKKEEGNWIYGQNKKKEGQNYINGSGLFWYENEEKDGLWIYYTKKGNGKYKVTYEKGNITTGQYIDSLGNKYDGEFVSSKDEKEKNNGSFIIQNSYNYDFTIQPNSSISYKNGKINGLRTVWGEEGGWSKTTYENGMKVGLARWWYKNGNLRQESNYESDKINGLTTMYYENGSKLTEVFCRDNKYHGLYKQWYQSGKKSRENNYNMGKVDGMYYVWHENGQKQGEGNMIDGKAQGIWKGWYENGNKQSEVDFKNGIEITSKWWNEDGSVKE